jgi:hypothetical protein
MPKKFSRRFSFALLFFSKKKSGSPTARRPECRHYFFGGMVVRDSNGPICRRNSAGAFLLRYFSFLKRKVAPRQHDEPECRHYFFGGMVVRDSNGPICRRNSAGAPAQPYRPSM